MSFRIIRGYRSSLKKTIPILDLPSGPTPPPSLPPPEVPDPDNDPFKRADRFKPPPLDVYREAKRDRRDWRTDPPEPEVVEKDISGCNLALNIAWLKAAKKMADAVMDRENRDDPMTSVEKAQLHRELVEDYRKAKQDYRACLMSGKSSANALYDEFVKAADEEVEKQINTLSKSILTAIE